jgi:succinoglycan biosynthesis protein ExoA
VTGKTSLDDRAPNGRFSSLPFVSVVLPIRDEEHHIAACIGRLVAQDYPDDRMEIIVVDGRSTDGTRERLRELQATTPRVPIHVLDNPAGMVSPALNIGIRAARGDVIVRMDGHTVPPCDYVSRCVAALHETGAANAGGVVEPEGLSHLGEAVAAASSHPLGVGDARYRTGGSAGFVDTVPFGTFRRTVFERIGLYDESMVRNQDYELNVRIRAAGERIYLDPAIRCTYTPRSDVRSLWSQYFQYGWWKVETIRRHPRSLRWRQAVAPAFVFLLVVLGVAAPCFLLAALAWSIMVATYAAAVVTVSLRLASEHRPARLIGLAFVIMHIAWGLGFLLNLLSGGRYPYRAAPPTIPRLDDSQGHTGEDRM